MVRFYDTATVAIESSLEKNYKRKNSIQEELHFIELNLTWVKAGLPPGRRAIQCKMIFERKGMRKST